MKEKFRNIPAVGGPGSYMVIPETVLVRVPLDRYESVRVLCDAVSKPSHVGMIGITTCTSDRRCDIEAAEVVNGDIISFEVFHGKDDRHYTIRCWLYPPIRSGTTREELQGQDYTCWDRVEAIAAFTGGTIESGSITVPREDAA